MAIRWQFPAVTLCLILAAPFVLHADIIRWDNGQLVPGTEAITPGPGVHLDHRQLQYALLTSQDLSGADFEASNLTRAKLNNSTLTKANLMGTNLTTANLSSSRLANADLTGAIVTGATFNDTTSRDSHRRSWHPPPATKQRICEVSTSRITT